MEDSVIAAELGIKKNTLQKAILEGRLQRIKKELDLSGIELSTKSSRVISDTQAILGIGVTHRDPCSCADESH